MAERVFAMPDLGEGLEDGEVVTWLVAEGDEVALNQPLVEVETAKATVEIPSPVAGVVASLRASEGSSVRVGEPLVTFDVADGVAGGNGSAGGPGGVRATPPVRKLAKELGVDLAAVTGTGPDGRITADDVRAAKGGSPVPRETPDDAERPAPLSPVRRAIAENLSRQAAIPQVTTFRTVDCEALETFRAELGVSPLPVMVAALCRVVERHPTLNATWTEDGIADRDAIHVGIATDTERGLVVPVVHDAQATGMGELASEIRRVAEAARDGSLAPADVLGATIAVSNTGSYGSEAGTPILSPGTSVTLALGVIAPRALVVGGEVVARRACTLSCTFDHRVLDGAAVGRALSDLVSDLQDAGRLGNLPR
jgi:2-oxoisovalerate dehydrogenase E2 component (dihydrolipoyl transacylase)